MASYVKVAGALELLLEGLNSGSDQWAFALTNTVPSGTAFVAGTTDLATGGGYTQGGTNVSTTSSAEAAATFKLILAAPTAWTASGGGFTIRYVLLVNKTNNITVAYWDYGSSVTLLAGETFKVDFDAGVGVLTLA